MKSLKLILAALFLIGTSSPLMAFQVKGKAISTTFCADGKCETEPCNDEVVYEVDIENKKVFRRAIINTAESLKETSLGGLQVDDTEYIILQGQLTATSRNGAPKVKEIIKAIGKTGSLDGIETIAIGEDFIHTARSSADYFVIYYYKIID